MRRLVLLLVLAGAATGCDAIFGIAGRPVAVEYGEAGTPGFQEDSGMSDATVFDGGLPAHGPGSDGGSGRPDGGVFESGSPGDAAIADDALSGDAAIADSGLDAPPTYCSSQTNVSFCEDFDETNGLAAALSPTWSFVGDSGSRSVLSTGAPSPPYFLELGVTAVDTGPYTTSIQHGFDPMKISGYELTFEMNVVERSSPFDYVAVGWLGIGDQQWYVSLNGTDVNNPVVELVWSNNDGTQSAVFGLSSTSVPTDQWVSYTIDVSAGPPASVSMLMNGLPVQRSDGTGTSPVVVDNLNGTGVGLGLGPQGGEATGAIDVAFDNVVIHPE